MRASAKKDLFYLATVVLGYEDLTPHTHGALCRFLTQARYARRMILMPRTHFKTTLAIVAHSIQLILENPNIRILIVGDNEKNTQLTLGEISSHFKYNELLQWLFPELIPDNFNKVRWNVEEIEVVRTRRWKEATVTAAGAFGGVESKHYDVIKADDLVVEKHIHSNTELDKLNKWVGGLEPLLIKEEDQIDFIGSRKRKGDTYEHILKFYEGDGTRVALGPYAELRGDIAVFSRSIVENNAPIFPERFGWKFIRRMMKNDPERYHAQLANDPKASGLNYFNDQDLRYFRLDEDSHIVTPEGERISIWDLERIILYDPSVAEKTSSSQQAIIVAAKGSDPRRFILEALIGHFSPTDAIDLLYDLNERFMPAFISIESRGFQGWVKYALEEISEARGLPSLPLIEWPPEGAMKGNWAKKEHIRGLQPIVKRHMLWVQEEQLELIEQIGYYPNVRWDDGLDALAQGLDYWPYVEDAEARSARISSEDRWLAQVAGDRFAKPDREWDEEKFLRRFTHTGYGLK